MVNNLLFHVQFKYLHTCSVLSFGKRTVSTLFQQKNFFCLSLVKIKIECQSKRREYYYKRCSHQINVIILHQFYCKYFLNCQTFYDFSSGARIRFPFFCYYKPIRCIFAVNLSHSSYCAQANFCSTYGLISYPDPSAQPKCSES